MIRATPPGAGARAGEQQRWQVEKFCASLGDICARAEDDVEFFDNMNDYCARIFALASECHVQLQSYFISTAIAIKILEGMASALDPEVDIANNALPYIVSARYRLGLQAKDVSVTRGG